MNPPCKSFQDLFQFQTYPSIWQKRCHAGFFFWLITLLVALWADAARAQGALTNGWTHTGTISPVGDSDSWTFSANAGDSIILRVGEITQTNSFTPRIRLQN